MTSKTTTAGSDTDRQAIRDVLASLYKAWEAGDADAFVADYTETPPWSSPASTRRTARRSAPRWPRRSRARSAGRGRPTTRQPSVS